MTTATEERPTRTVTIPPFGIEADHPRNSDLLIQCIPGVRLRSTIDGSKPVVDAKTGDLKVPLDQSRGLASFPRTPGMQIHVNPEELTYAVIDPMHGNDELCERVSRFLREQNGLRLTNKINGVPPQTGKLDVHRMKSLCREMITLVESKEAKKCKGPLPDLVDVDRMPGHYLLNPGSIVPNTQPRYEKDLEDWVNQLSRSGG